MQNPRGYDSAGGGVPDEKAQAAVPTLVEMAVRLFPPSPLVPDFHEAELRHCIHRLITSQADGVHPIAGRG